MNGQRTDGQPYAVLHIGERFAGLAAWGVMVRERTDDDGKLVCIGCTREEAGDLVRKLNAGHSTCLHTQRANQTRQI